MTQFVLVIVDAEHMILATEDALTASEVRTVRKAFDTWKEDGGIAVISSCVVRDQQAGRLDIELDLAERANEAEVRHERLTEEGHV